MSENQLADQLPTLNEENTDTAILDNVIAEAKSLRAGPESTSGPESISEASSLSEAKGSNGVFNPFNVDAITNDGYELIELIGHGGMGVVYTARERSLDRMGAIKVLAPTVANDAAAGQRFLREARAAASVVHPNIITIHAVSDSPPLPYLVMEYVEGVSLQQQLDSGSPISFENTVRIGRQMAAGLDAAHKSGLVHRDVKPANILLNARTGKVLLSDFGLALAAGSSRYTSSGTLVGTAAYVAPEALEGSSTADHRSDLYGMGVVLYAMCTGSSPFQAENLLATIRRVAASDPRPLTEVKTDVPVWFSRLVARLLNKDPNERFQTAADVHLALGKGLGSPVAACELGGQDRPMALVSSHTNPNEVGVAKHSVQRKRLKTGVLIPLVGALVLIGFLAGVVYSVSKTGAAKKVEAIVATTQPSEFPAKTLEHLATNPTGQTRATSLRPSPRMMAASDLAETSSQLPEATRRFVCFASDGSYAGSFDDLEDAVDDQPVDGWVEVSGGIHVISDPVFLEGARVSIKAAHDSHPILVFHPAADVDDLFDEEFDDELFDDEEDDFDDDSDEESMLSVEGHLIMEGIEIRINADDFGLPIIQVEAEGALELTACILNSTSPGCCLASQAGVTLNECEIHASAAAAMELESASEVVSTLRNCWISGMTGIELSGEDDHQLLLDHCAFACEQSIRVFDSQDFGAPIVRSDASVFFNLEGLADFDEDVEARNIRWIGSGNVYAGAITRAADESALDGGFARWTAKTGEANARYIEYPFHQDRNAILRAFDSSEFRLSQMGLSIEVAAGPERNEP
ncbi:MAG: protein kinase [Planctomycetota bacterium]